MNRTSGSRVGRFRELGFRDLGFWVEGLGFRGNPHIWRVPRNVLKCSGVGKVALSLSLSLSVKPVLLRL